MCIVMCIVPRCFPLSCVVQVPQNKKCVPPLITLGETHFSSGGDKGSRTSDLLNGDDMRSHIRQNILGCDLALLMISGSYIKSSICLNEMGAIWGMPIPNVNVFVCHDCKLPDSIGWLYEVKKLICFLAKKHLIDCMK